jgi:hypothetical protein
MSFVTTQPEMLASAAGDVQSMVPAAADEVSFVNTLGTSAGSYAATEAANAATMH